MKMLMEYIQEEEKEKRRRKRERLIIEGDLKLKDK